ncbi:hypothetical protein HOY82DRAFT_543022 [Tuber indicum]|nr:hypothetical protein HOY82DRAFT_543022 [Tuber indicum]
MLTIHPNHAFSAGSSCRACQCLDHKDLAVEQKAENKAVEIDVLLEEWVGHEEQARAWKLAEQLKLERGRKESREHGAPKKGVEENGTTQEIKGKRRKHRR